MIGDLKVLALIPARGGSKGIKDKNIKDLDGLPLLAYTAKAAKDSKYIDAAVLSTDSEAIANVAAKYGLEIPFFRPVNLALDTSKSIDAVLHAISTLKKMGREYDVLVLLQPTSPLRTTKNIDEALEKFVKKGRKSLVSVSEVDEHPILMRTINSDDELESLMKGNSTVRRQDMKKIYKVNGSIYINNTSEISVETSFNDNLVPFIVDKTEAIDIDEEKDLMLAEYYLKS